jgi:hypothetical protein
MSALRVLAAFAMALAPCVAQTSHDPEASARDYVQFLVVQLDQWSVEFPQQFYMAVMKPPVDAGKLSEAGKAAAGELGDSIKKLAALVDGKDILTGATFRGQLDKTLASAKEVNQVMAAQRFPAILQSDWEQIRSTLNNLARVYKVEMLAALEPPGGGGGRGGRAKTAATGPVPGGGLSGYIVDLACARRGKGMWANAECVARCVRDGDKVVLVTEEGKIYQISNQDKITPDSYGQIVTLTGKAEGDTIRVDAVKM